MLQSSIRDAADHIVAEALHAQALAWASIGMVGLIRQRVGLYRYCGGGGIHRKGAADA